jgi:hypothetical protein
VAGGIGVGLFTGESDLPSLPFGATATGEDGSQYFGGADGNAVQTSPGTGGMSQGGQSDFSQYAQATGQGTQALVNLLFGNKQLKFQKKISGLQHAQVGEENQMANLDSSQNEVGAYRAADRARNDARAQAGAAGMGNSSAAEQSQKDINYESNVKLDAIRRQRALMNDGYARQQQIWDLQKKMARAQQQSAAIAAGIDTAISLAQII